MAVAAVVSRGKVADQHTRAAGNLGVLQEETVNGS